MASAAVPASVGFLHPATATNAPSARAIVPGGNVESPASPTAPDAATKPAARSAPSWCSNRPCTASNTPPRSSEDAPAPAPPSPASASSSSRSAAAAPGAGRSRRASTPHSFAATRRVGASTCAAKCRARATAAAASAGSANVAGNRSTSSSSAAAAAAVSSGGAAFTNACSRNRRYPSGAATRSGFVPVSSATHRLTNASAADMASGGRGRRAVSAAGLPRSGCCVRRYANTAVAEGSAFRVALFASEKVSARSVKEDALSSLAKRPAGALLAESSSSSPGGLSPARPSSRTSALASPAATTHRYRAGTWSKGNSSRAHCAATSRLEFSAPELSREPPLAEASMDERSRPSMAIATPPPQPLYARASARAAPCTEARTLSGSEASAPKTRAAISAEPVTSAGVRAESCPSAW